MDLQPSWTLCLNKSTESKKCNHFTLLLSQNKEGSCSPPANTESFSSVCRSHWGNLFVSLFGSAQDCKSWELRFAVCSVHGMEMLAALLNPGILLPRGKDSKQTEAAGTETHWTLLRRDRTHYCSTGMNSKVNSCRFALNCKKCNTCTTCDTVRLFAMSPWLQKFYSLANSRSCCSSDAVNIEKASRR